MYCRQLEIFKLYVFMYLLEIIRNILTFCFCALQTIRNILAECFYVLKTIMNILAECFYVQKTIRNYTGSQSSLFGWRWYWLRLGSCWLTILTALTNERKAMNVSAVCGFPPSPTLDLKYKVGMS